MAERQYSQGVQHGRSAYSPRKTTAVHKATDAKPVKTKHVKVESDAKLVPDAKNVKSKRADAKGVTSKQAKPSKVAEPSEPVPSAPGLKGRRGMKAEPVEAVAPTPAGQSTASPPTPTMSSASSERTKAVAPTPSTASPPSSTMSSASSERAESEAPTSAGQSTASPPSTTQSSSAASVVSENPPEKAGIKMMTPQERNTEFQRFKRAMNSKRNPPPQNIMAQYEEAFSHSPSKMGPKLRLFEMYFKTGGNFKEMESMLQVKTTTAKTDAEKDFWVTRAQLADHYKVKEDSTLIKAIIAKKEATKQMRLHPEIPEIDEAKLYFCMKELSQTRSHDVKATTTVQRATDRDPNEASEMVADVLADLDPVPAPEPEQPARPAASAAASGNAPAATRDADPKEQKKEALRQAQEAKKRKREAENASKHPSVVKGEEWRQTL